MKLLIIILALLSTTTYAQKDTVYYDLYNQRIKDKKDAAYFRLPYEKEGDKYKVTTYYASGRLQSEGYSRSLDQLIWDGEHTVYHENGTKSLKGEYANGYRVRTWKKYYEDSPKVWVVSSYSPFSDTVETLRSFYRSGKLKRIEYRVRRKNIMEFRPEADAFESTGICYKETGEEMPFTPFEKMPEFNGNVQAYLGNNIRYPYEARENNIEGKVWVCFLVHTDGSIVVTDAIVSDPTQKTLIAESIRVVKQMNGNWRTGTIDDKPVRVMYSLPVLFRLQ